MKFARKTIATLGVGRCSPLGVFFALVAGLLPAVSNAAINGWDWLNPRPSAYQLWSVSFGDANTGVAVGQGAGILTTSDGGATWLLRDSVLPPDITLNFTLWRVRFVDSTNVVAIGGYILFTGEAGATVVHSADGGATWTRPGDPLPDVDFSDAYFSDPQNGMAVGLNLVSFQPTISRTSDGGATWDTQTFETSGFLKAIAFPKQNVGFAVGIDFAQSQALALGTSDGGDTWAPISIPSSNQLNDIEFLNADFGVIVGNAGTLFTTSDGGVTWEPQTTDTPVDLHAVTFTADGTILAMGGDFANSGIILTSTDGGVSWSPQTFDRSIEGAAFGSANGGTAVGYAGAMLQTSNGGQSWSPQQESVSPNALFGLAFADARTGTAVGDVGTILRTKDGGQTWRTQTSGTDLPLFGVTAVDAEVLMAVGGDLTTGDRVILRTTDGGTTWTDVTPPDLGVPAIAVACPTASVCTVAAACGQIVRTEDGGTTWVSQRAFDCQTQANLEGVYFFDTLKGITVGRDTILQTTDGGTTWVPQASPLGPVEALHGVTFVDANSGYIAAGSTADLGTILHTSDGGATWTIQRGDIPTNVTSVAFANLNDGIAVTLGGDIYQTHDGGTTWDLHTPMFANLFAVAYKENATAIAVGTSNYIATILGFNDRVFADGFDPAL